MNTLLTWRTTDDRGRPARLAIVVWPRDASGQPRPTWRAAGRMLLSGTRARVVQVPVLALLALGLVAAAVLNGGPSVLALLSFSPVLSISLLIVFSGLIAFSDGIEQHKDRLKNTRLRENQCPACGYSLQELEPSADGCLVCPECGGAWRLARLDDPQRVVIRQP